VVPIRGLAEDGCRRDEDHLINGLLCTVEIRSLGIRCPACAMNHEVRACDRRSLVFDRRRQRFRCSSCRFAANVHVIVDVTAHPYERKRSPAAK
jgi:transposase-like protein